MEMRLRTWIFTSGNAQDIWKRRSDCEARGGPMLPQANMTPVSFLLGRLFLYKRRLQMGMHS